MINKLKEIISSRQVVNLMIIGIYIAVATLAAQYNIQIENLCFLLFIRNNK